VDEKRYAADMNREKLLARAAGLRCVRHRTKAMKANLYKGFMPYWPGTQALPCAIVVMTG